MRTRDKDLAQIIWDYMRYEQPIESVDVIVGLGSSDVRTANGALSCIMKVSHP